MNRHALSRFATFSASLALATGLATAALAQTPPSVEGQMSAAKSAAGLDWAGAYLRLCVPPPPVTIGGGGAPSGTPPRDAWYAEPAKVADNLYFIGTKIHSSWAIVGSDGIIIIDGLFDYATNDEMVGGLKKLGLDINKVKYVVFSHAHADHDGGAKFLQDTLPGARIVYGEADWALATAANHPGGPVRRDMVGTDGMKISVGADATITIVTTPGHTPGSMSYVFTVKDNGKPLNIAYSGGTAIPFDGKAEFYDGYIASAAKIQKAATESGATVLLSNHTEFDNAYFKAHTANNRAPGAPNPFDVGQAGVQRYFTVVQQCATAAKLRATKQ